MADKDYRTETNANSIDIHFKLPRIEVPKLFAEDEWGGISFKIETSKGVIKATSSRRKGGVWMCRGDIPSLVAGGFIHPDWCPGLPGNNKTRQTVLFENNSPRLIYGNHRGTKLSDPYIVIIRVSKNKFVVEIPATEEQWELIKQADERWRQRMRDKEEVKRQEEQLKQKERRRKQKPETYSHPDYFKDSAISLLNVGLIAAMKELRGEHELSGYNEMTIWIDEQSAQDVLCAQERLIDSIRKAKIIRRKKDRHLSIVN